MENWPWPTIVTTVAAVVALYGAWLGRLNYQLLLRRNRQDTVSAWGEVRKAVPEGGFPQLESDSKLTSEERAALKEMEYFSACINSGIYDFDIFERLSKSWFMTQYEKVKLYIESRDNPAAYSELKSLHQKVTSMRAEKGILRRLCP